MKTTANIDQIISLPRYILDAHFCIDSDKIMRVVPLLTSLASASPPRKDGRGCECQTKTNFRFQDIVVTQEGWSFVKRWTAVVGVT